MRNQRPLISTAFCFSLLLFFSCVAGAQTHTGGAPGVATTEEDGSPDIQCITYKFANGNVTDNGDGTCSIADGGGTGTMNTVKENDVGVGGSDIVTIDFLGADFDLTESPDTEIQIVINDGGVDHDATTNFVAAEHVTEASISHDTIADVSTNDHHTPAVTEVNKDIVTTAPITGGENNVLPGADADLTIAITVLKDIVTTSPITGGENDVLTGSDADLTIALTLLKDIVTTAPVTGGEDNVLPGSDADLTIAITVLKDLVTTAPLTGGTDDIFTGSDSDITIASQLL